MNHIKTWCESFLQRSYPPFIRLATISFISRLNWLTLRMPVQWTIRDNTIFLHLSDQLNHTGALNRLINTFLLRFIFSCIHKCLLAIFFIIFLFEVLHSFIQVKKYMCKNWFFSVCVTREGFKFSFPDFATATDFIDKTHLHNSSSIWILRS